MIKMLSSAAVIVATATASFAGSLNNTAADPVVYNDDPVVPVVGSGIGLPLVLGGIAAAGVAAAVLSDDDDNDDTTTTEED